MLNVEEITEVRWWEHPDFKERPALEAAELVAFDVLDPALRSRGRISTQARQLYGDSRFCEKMRLLFQEEPADRLIIPSLQEALERIATLEKRLDTIEKHIRGG